MQPYRADRVVRVLTAIVSVMYFAMWGVGILVLLMLPVGKLAAGTAHSGADAGERNFTWDISVPVSMTDTGSAVRTEWGPARLVLEHAGGSLQFGDEAFPWRAVAVVWLAFAGLMALGVLTLYQLRRILQRVRDGAPFDAQNARRMRTLGLLLVAGVVYDSVLDLITTVVVREITSGVVTPRAWWTSVDVLGIFMALVVVALAEVFRRGAELEDEQSLVV